MFVAADGSAGDTVDVTFGWAPGRVLAASLVVGLVGAVVGNAVLFMLFSLLAGRLAWPGAMWLVTIVFGYAVCFAGFSLLFTRGRPPWVRSSEAGVELAASRSDPVFIPWSGVSTARFRWRGPLTLLEITPSDPVTVAVGQRGGWRPRRRRRGGRVSYVVDVGALRAGPAAVRAELVRHGCRLLG